MTSGYFNTLNYTLANEDTALEMAILPEGAAHVLAVAGSGARVLPLFARSPRRLTCVDVSQEQLWLTELRIESARQLSREEFCRFWGYPPVSATPSERQLLFKNINVSAACRGFFLPMFEQMGWTSLLYLGRWERTFRKISQLSQKFLGDDANKVFHALERTQHMNYFIQDFPWFRWNLLVAFVGNSSFFNALLYKGHFPKKNTPGSHRVYYKDAYNRIFSAGIPRENFFLQLTLLGEIQFAEGNPIECHSGVYERIQKGLQSAEIRYHLGNVVEAVSAQRSCPVDFLSISDVPSYFDEATGQDFLQTMSEGLAPGSLSVVRYYLRVLHNVDVSGFERKSHFFQSAIAAEKTQMYTVDVFQKR